MNRIEKKFKELKRAGKKAFIVYICAGDPDINTTYDLVMALDKAGADIIELGMPFSDPLADGPTIQEASQRALKKGANITKIFALIKRIRKQTQIPLVLMGYFNPVLRYGVNKFIKDAKTAGADGSIIPDLPTDEAGEFIKTAKPLNFDTIFLISPTSKDARIKHIAQKSTGFVYYVSLTGVTGARTELPSSIKEDVRRIKRCTKKPVCVGFGISKPQQVKDICKFADGVIVGSVIVKQIEANLGNKKAMLAAVVKLVKQLRGVR